MTNLNDLILNAKDSFDLTEAADQGSLMQLTEALLNMEDVTLAEIQARAREEESPLEFKIAAKLVESRQFMLGNSKKLHIGVVFGMWGEQNRLRPKNADNPHGEDSLRVKLEQLDWVTQDSNVSWTLYPVDDGCPYDSGKLAQEIAAAHPLGDHVQVLFLAETLPAESGPLQKLASANDSRKAGAVILGAMQAIADGADAVIYTDADNSVHLGQIGLLLKPYIKERVKVVLGNRKHPDAVLVKEGARWGIGIKALRHMQRMVGHAIFSRNILDTQAAFKLYDSELLSQIIAEPTVFDFSFDTDWIAGAISLNERLVRVPFAFIDSAAESASAKQMPMTTWETLLLGLLKSMRRYNLLETEASQQMAKVLDEEIHDYRDLELLIDHLPAELEKAGEKEYGDPAVMSPAALQLWIQQRKREEE
ncbi:MAG: hypothetical protein KDE51_08720 [Anaerolineales bacterium]|nr:hypothetical protein [Anaerolineales bacterium]